MANTPTRRPRATLTTGLRQTKLPALPQLLARKIYKTGQTRGADDDVIFQNRVGRNSTVLLPLSRYKQCVAALPLGESFESGYIVLVSPDHFFDGDAQEKLNDNTLVLGQDAILFYETREQWAKYNPMTRNLKIAERRRAPLGGVYAARVPATTSLESGEGLRLGYNTTSNKGAGIRVYEYASLATINACRLQLEALFWLCTDAIDVVIRNGMTREDATHRREWALQTSANETLLDFNVLIANRLLSKMQVTHCPLCLEELSAAGFFSRMEQAEGREVPDLTVTQLNLFHIRELRLGALNHRPYNLGWGHHHCNVVTKDSGIVETLNWMKQIVEKNADLLNQ